MKSHSPVARSRAVTPASSDRAAAFGDQAPSDAIAPPISTRDRPARVLCITPLGLDGRGGIDRLYRYLRDLPRPDGAAAMRYVVSRGEAPGLLWIPTFPWHLARCVWAIATWRPDLVHINFANGGSLPRKLAIIRAAQLFRRPVAIHFHCAFPTEAVRERTVSGRMFLTICRAAAEVIAIGHATRRQFIADAGLDPARVTVITNGAPDIGRDLVLPKRGSSVRILFAGQLGSRKGHAILVQALARLRDHPDWTCTIAGDGDVAGCRELCRAAGVAERVSITGWISSDTVRDLMREADIVVLPSEREVMPMSLVEGAAAGAALVATPVGEIRDIVHDAENGYLIARDPDDVAAKLGRLIVDRPLLARMQQSSRRLYEAEFRLETFACRLEAVYARWAAAPRTQAGSRPVRYDHA